MDRIKKRYPLSPEQKKIIKLYEKVTPGELAHIDLTKVTKNLRTVLNKTKTRDGSSFQTLKIIFTINPVNPTNV